MDSESANQMDNGETTTLSATQKMKILSNGTDDLESSPARSERKSAAGTVVENGLTCNGSVAADDSHVSGDDVDMRDDNDECVKDRVTKAEGSESLTSCDGDNNSHGDGDGGDVLENTCKEDGGDFRDDVKENDPDAGSKYDSGNTVGALQESLGNSGNKPGITTHEERRGQATADIPNKNACSDNDEEIVNTPEAKPNDIQQKDVEKDSGDSVKGRRISAGKESLQKTSEDITNCEELAADSDKEKVVSSKYLRSSNKKNKKTVDKREVVGQAELGGSQRKGQKIDTPKQAKGLKESKRTPSTSDDVEIVGESKVALAGSRDSQNAHFGLHGSGMPGLNRASPATAPSAASAMHGLMPGFPGHGMSPLPAGFPLPGAGPAHGPQNTPVHVPTVAPPKPKSSLDQIELIRWEIQNRINTRPKYFKPNPSSDLGPLAKFLFDIGSDLIKEAVYHDLVKIQSKKNGDNKLNAKEKEDLQKLKEIEKDLFSTIGHLKLKLRQKCKVCNFQTESNNVMFYHKQYPHEDNKFLRCAHCPFTTKQAVAFKFHMEAEHAIQAKLHDKKAFYECDLCPYENNQEQKLVLHKQRCIKQFRPLFNLHPSCLSGAEINLCLENIFYKPVVPKNLKLLQQKHAQQQAALAEARRQQAQMQVLAAQKNAAAIAAKKQQQQQQQLQKSLPATPSPRTSGRMSQPRLPVQPPPPPPPQQQPVRYNASNSKAPCPTVATMLNTKQNTAPTPPGPAGGAAAAGGFEVCEICGGYVKDRKALRIHFFYAHRIDLPFNLFDRTHAPLYCATCYVRFWTAHGLRKHIDTHKEENQTRGVVGKCISCGHHVLNLLLHMRVVHNREMQHYITALMCMFCGNHFGSPQECEQHILKVHGNIDPLTGTLKSAPSGAVPQPAPQKPPPNKKPGNNNLVKGSVCVLCNLNFGRNVDLTRHCMRMHHTCMKCGMVVIDKASLMKHTCLSSPSGTRDCAMCGEVGFHPAYYVKHLRDKHLKKFSIRVSKVGKNTIERWTKRPYPFKEPDVLVEISDDEANDDSTGHKTSPPPPGKRPRIGPASKTGRPKFSPEKLDAPAADEDTVPGGRDAGEDTNSTKESVSVDTAQAGNSDSEPSDLSSGHKRKLESSGSDIDSKRKK